MMPPKDLHRLFDQILDVGPDHGGNDQNGEFLPLVRPVGRLGLALEPWAEFSDWIAREQLDAVFLHRPWSLTETQRRELAEAKVGVFAYHSAFDDHLTTGFNPALARSLGWGVPTAFAHRDGRPLGMTCALHVAQTFAAVVASLREEFGGLEAVALPTVGGDAQSVMCLAVAGAMTDAFVREAHAAGAGAYVTGQWRQPARLAVEATGLGVVTIGHRRSEDWGLRALAIALQELGGEESPEMVFAPSLDAGKVG